MTTEFRLIDGKAGKVLKELYITGHIPTTSEGVIIKNEAYAVVSAALDTDNVKWVIWLRKLQ